MPASPPIPPNAPLDEVYLVIGRIVAPHGVQGEVRLALATDRPERIPDLRRVYLDDDPTAIRLSRARLHGGERMAVLKLQGINDRNAAEALRGTTVKIRADQLPPPEEGAFFHFQIIGLQVFDEAGASFGTVVDIIETGEVDVYVVRDDAGTEHLFPALRDVVLEINPDEGRMIVRPQEWAE